MSRPTHYVPRIGRHLVCALYHEARHRRQPMTRLVEDLLTAALQETAAWKTALHQHPPPSNPGHSTSKRAAAAVPP